MRTYDFIHHRVREAKEIEKEPVFKEDSSYYDQKTGGWFKRENSKERKLITRWLKIINERIKKLPKSEGRKGVVQHYCPTAQGQETSICDSQDYKPGDKKEPAYMRAAREEREVLENEF